MQIDIVAESTLRAMTHGGSQAWSGGPVTQELEFRLQAACRLRAPSKQSEARPVAAGTGLWAI